ncbi:conserved hypothetical protein [Anaeromyxobacter dehalogenans 2CP-1]|uniref:Cytoplasmic protein n=1 Tax=Anaeromyxobacter dehalogenans (strain ATCC BAA-258 / DSM 21875 / 2CP-1) TaxID=455488 RepID=B8JFR1_ANAD2|nr:BREX protein BrxB domain-containing protein [Anaeromyxobacter dehalogenans]ACL64499.1 conserved hypothetical protein [Anaeromyxobacter dehalogenans 2CP-1]
MTEPLFQQSTLDDAVQALRRDLLADGGPRISTMRNYRFAILPYKPAEEFKLRKLMRRLADDLKGEGWGVLAISLQKLLLDRIRATGTSNVEALIAREKSLHGRDPERALEHLRQKIGPLIEGPGGIAADVARLIDGFAAANPDADRTLVLVGRSGALYPFFRTSALLKHIDGKTRNIPVVLLYPGERRGTTELSFMGELKPDRDYRPRIYP